MVFSSIIFLLYFLPLVISIYFVGKREFRNYILIAFSLLFYFWGESYYLAILIGSVIFNYFLGKILDEYKSKAVLFLGVSVNLLIIAYFKYYNFLLSNSNDFFKTSFTLQEIHLPIGISFFTFQLVSYLVDIYRSQVTAQSNFSRFILYISFFPQLIAGPIVRYIDIQRELNYRRVNWNDIDVGLRRFIFGLSKKILIANPMALVADKIFAIPIGDMNTPLAWLGTISYTLQIYYDFSGYSDMAIGIGRIFGFHFMENFNLPYSATSVQDFWRRWHISLSTWFRDYVYIPLGGNRVSKFRTIFNLLIVFLLTGLWHGASWNFIIWGMLHGSFLLLEKFFSPKFSPKIPYFLGNIYTILVVSIAWVFFRIDGLFPATKIIQFLVNFDFRDTTYYPELYMNTEFLLALAFGIFFCYPILEFIRKTLFNKNFKDLEFVTYSIKSVLSLVLLIYCIMNIAGNTYNPFIYFRF